MEGIEIDFDNIPGSSSCIFLQAPLDILPVFDYSSKGMCIYAYVKIYMLIYVYLHIYVCIHIYKSIYIYMYM
jgi:hypothetical protein